MSDTDIANARVRHLLANAVERYMSPCILCNATADQLRGGSVPLWSIEVQGLSPHDHRRVYEIEAKSDTLAAQEGIRRFVEEMEILADERQAD